MNITMGYHQTNRKTYTGKTLKLWPVFVDHFCCVSCREPPDDVNSNRKTLHINVEGTGNWTAPTTVHKFCPHDEACSKASGLTPGPVVEHFNVIEDIRPNQIPGFVYFLPDAFFL